MPAGIYPSIYRNISGLRPHKKGEYKHTKETRKKMSVSQKGKKLSEKTKEKISKTMSIRQIGNKIWLGRHHSEYTKKRLSEINKGRKVSEETKRKISEAQKGRKLSEEHKKKISESNFKRYKEKPFLKEQISEKMRGEKSIQWRGGISKRCLNNRKYKKWRMTVFMRDNFTCQFCGIRCHIGLGKCIYLEAHHIKSWNQYPELRFDINNGITLCKDCHNLTKGRQRKALAEEIKENE